MATKLGGLNLQVYVKYISFCIITTTRPQATKLDNVMTYYKKRQPIKPHNPLNMCSREVT